jgi:hypothetical protein
MRPGLCSREIAVFEVQHGPIASGLEGWLRLCWTPNRVCSFEDGHAQDERILDYSPQNRSYRYEIEGAPLPVTDNAGRFSVQEANDHTRVVWDSSFESLNPTMGSQLAEMWEPYLPITLANLKNLVEAAATKPA